MYIKKTNKGPKFFRDGVEIPAEKAKEFLTGGQSKLVEDTVKANVSYKKEGGAQDLPRPIFMQDGGAYSPEKWNKEQMSKGLMPSPGYSGETIKSNKSFLEFYDPTQYKPTTDKSGTVSWGKINDPNYKYSSESESPFIKYTPPPKQVKPVVQKTYIEPDPNIKPFEFGAGYNFDPNTNTYFTGPAPLADKSNIIQPLTKQMGGALDKFMTNYQKQFGGSAGIKDIQGQSMDQFLETKNNNFINYLASNNTKALYKDEMNTFQTTVKAVGGEVGNPGNPKTQQPFGQDQGVPDYVSGITNQFNFSTVDTPSENPFVSKPLENVNSQQNNQQLSNFKPMEETNTSNVADFVMAGAQGLNSFFNKANTYKQEQLAKQKGAISNTSAVTYGSRGDYDINQGTIRPDEKTPIKFKKGGTYKVDKKSIQDLIAKGYNVEFLD